MNQSISEYYNVLFKDIKKAIDSEDEIVILNTPIEDLTSRYISGTYLLRYCMLTPIELDKSKQDEIIYTEEKKHFPTERDVSNNNFKKGASQLRFIEEIEYNTEALTYKIHIIPNKNLQKITYFMNANNISTFGYSGDNIINFTIEIKGYQSYLSEKEIDSKIDNGKKQIKNINKKINQENVELVKKLQPIIENKINRKKEKNIKVKALATKHNAIIGQSPAPKVAPVKKSLPQKVKENWSRISCTNLSTAFISAVALGELIHIRYYYPDVIKAEKALKLHEELATYFESATSSPGFDRIKTLYNEMNKSNETSQNIQENCNWPDIRKLKTEEEINTKILDC